jgi:centromere/kinetochore protein ZW10
VLGILDYGLAKLADLIIKYVVSAAVNRGSPISFVEELNQDPKEMTEAVLKIVPSVEPMVNTNNDFGIILKILTLVVFLFNFSGFC